MKSRLEKVLDKMPNKKVDLKAHKVALGLVDDLKTIQEESSNAYVSYIDDMDTSKGYLSQAINKAENAIQLLSQSVSLYNEVEKRFNELGMDVPSELQNQTPLPALQESEKDYDMMNTIFSQFKVR